MENEKQILGRIGDSNPVEHGGGIIRDCGHGPELLYFQPWGCDDKVSVYSFPIEEDAISDLDWANFEDVASFMGIEKEEIEQAGKSENIVTRACVYESVGMYYGFDNLDSYPQTFDIEDAELIFEDDLEK